MEKIPSPNKDRSRDGAIDRPWIGDERGNWVKAKEVRISFQQIRLIEPNWISVTSDVRGKTTLRTAAKKTSDKMRLQFGLRVSNL